MTEANRPLHSSNRWAHLILGVGTFLLLTLVGEALFYTTRPTPIPPSYSIGVVTSLPFNFGLIYGGYWLTNSGLSAARYKRIGGWCLGGLAVFLLINLGLMIVVPIEGAVLVSWVRWAASLGGGVGLMIGIFEARAIDRELTSQRLRIRQEETRQKNERLEEFATIVSHDLRNPLTVASGRLELAREEYDSPHLEIVASAHDRMSSIIEDTLILAREGQTVGRTELVDLSGIARECWTVIDSVDANLVIEGTITFRADKDRLKHVFENLFRNAIEHGCDDVSIRVGPLENATGFFVEDDGTGIPADQRKKVFEPGHTTTEQGTGFGLAIVQRIVEAHGWEIGFSDSREGGTRLEITGVETSEPGEQHSDVYAPLRRAGK